MAINMSSDIYKIVDFVDDVQKKFFSIDSETTLTMGMFGYLADIHSNILQNSIVMTSEYSNEAIPIKAKFEKNVIAHALSLGITKLNAKPATMKVMLHLKEDRVLANMKDDKFIIDKDFKIMIGTYEFHLDYDIIIKRNKLVNDTYVYTVQYDITGKNILSDITNPYITDDDNKRKNLSSVNIINTNVGAMLGFSCILRQVKYNQIYKKILVDNPLENKIMNFSFDSKLAAFDINVNENGAEHYLTPVYDGLADYNEKNKFSYMYLDSSNIRIKFIRTVYEPRVNSDVIINVYTTEGADGNFTYKDDSTAMLTSDRFEYNDVFMLIRPLTDSIGGVDRKSIEELKIIIPKEALSRGSITTYSDLNNYFNSINDEDSRLYFLEKVHNALDRVYYSYLLLRTDNIIIPTNTINIKLNRSEFNITTTENNILLPGNVILYNGDNGMILKNMDQDRLDLLENDGGFMYINPFMMVVNKSPFFVSYFLNIINIDKELSYNYVNENSQIQFISNYINCKREYFTDRNKYKFNISFLQNINTDVGLIVKDEYGDIIDVKMRVFLVLQDESGNAYRYKEAKLESFYEDDFIYTFNIEIDTDDVINRDNKLKINDLIEAGREVKNYGLVDGNTKASIYVYIEDENGSGKEEADKIIPNMGNYTLSNKYDVITGLDFFYNYTNIISSYIDLVKTGNGLDYTIKKVPLIRHKYINSEERMITFINELEKRRYNIEYSLSILEDSFGIDFKFFNTYGPSKIYNIDHDLLLDKVNLSLTFELKLRSFDDKYITNYIKRDIKTYIENINDISDLHMSNLITHITNIYDEQIVYFKFIKLNDYNVLNQSIYRNVKEEKMQNLIVPEFINVNTINVDEPDITLIVVD